jgi:threonine dehydrogenase-like Zn-dependent dehydrogenase
MIQAILYGARDLRLEEKTFDPAAIGEGEVYVETDITALSTGTDLGNYLGRSTEVPGAPSYPRWVGYSNVGIIKKTGASVRNLVPGQRVFSMKPHLSAFVAGSSELMVPVPETVSSEQASLVYLTQLGVAAMRQARYEAGETVAVVGLGVIELGTVAMARALGARVFAVANSDLRAAAARGLGAEEVLHSAQPAPANAADIVVLTANTWESFRYSVDLVRYGGRISVLGFPGRAQPAPDFNPLDPAWFYGKQLTLIGAGLSSRVECQPWDIRFNLRRNLEFILSAMAAGTINLEPIISHRFPARNMRDAYELASTHAKELMAAVFDWKAI